MDDPNRPLHRRFRWPARRNTERRLFPRLSIEFPVLITLAEDIPPIEALARDVSLGGLRLESEYYLPLFSRMALRIELPNYTSDGEIVTEPVDVTVAVVRIEPDEESDEVDTYEVALAFTRLSEESERTIGRFMLQMLLIEPGSELR